MTEPKEKGSRKHKKLLWAIPLFLIFLLGMIFLIYVRQYSPADPSAKAALQSDSTVSVTKTDYGWFFDGPSETDAIIFYPGGKVEETAYAVLLHDLAAKGMDACLVRMPFHLAVLGRNKAAHVMKEYDYDHWYIGGHSLGGVMAADYAADHSADLDGVYLLAAYPAKPLSENTQTVMIYGSEDSVLNMEKLKEANQYLPSDSDTCVIQGGNHAQFGNYGTQKGDGTASISSEEQQKQTVALILENSQSPSEQSSALPS